MYLENYNGFCVDRQIILYCKNKKIIYGMEMHNIANKKDINKMI
jgi:hypothetical protein